MKRINHSYTFKSFLIISVSLVLIFILTLFNVMRWINQRLYSDIKEESYFLAESYTYLITKSNEALEELNILLDQHLLTSSEVIAKSSIHLTQSRVNEMKSEFDLDAIYVYNSDGVIELSTHEEYLGWTIYPGHPVYDQFYSHEGSSVEDIRKDSESDQYYKYGYYRLTDGSMVQVGILADRIIEIEKSLSIQTIINQVSVADKKLSIIRYFNDQNQIIASSDQRNGEYVNLSPDEKLAVEANTIHGAEVTMNKTSYYKVLIPVYNEDGLKKLGTLEVYISLDDLALTHKAISIFTILFLFIIQALISIGLWMIHRRNNAVYDAFYNNPVTKFPNKASLDHYIDKSLKKKGMKALVLINFRQFKLINLTFGYLEGNKLMKDIATKVSELVEGHRVFHIPDGLVVYMEAVQSKDEVEELVKTSTESFNNYFNDTEYSNYIKANIGIVIFDERSNYKDATGILNDALISIDSILDNNYKFYQFFDETMQKRQNRRKLIEHELQTVIKNYKNKYNDASFYLEFQPQMDTKTGEIVGFEGLARLKSSELGQVPPMEFIEIAERRQLIVPLSRIIIKKGIDFIQQLKEKGYPSIRVAVNVSVQQLLQESFIPFMKEQLEVSQINPTQLELEITESMLMEDYDRINAALQQLRELGISIALDDFGTGYSSLARLKSLQVDYLKIDKLFIDRLVVSPPNELITGDMISIAHRYGLKVIAEGVENSQQVAYLKNQDCDLIQGYYYSKPVPVEEAFNLLELYNSIQSYISRSC